MAESAIRPRRAPFLYRDGQRPPADAWNLQIAPPMVYWAWLESQTAPGEEPPAEALGLRDDTNRRVMQAVDEALSMVPSNVDDCERGWWTTHPHVHMILSSVDRAKRPLTREVIERVGAAAYLDQSITLIDYLADRGLVRAPGPDPWDGIELVIDGRRVDDSHLDPTTPCPGNWNLANVVVACP